MKNLSKLSPIRQIKMSDITDFSFDPGMTTLCVLLRERRARILCRSYSTENYSPFEGGLKGDVNRIKKYGVLNPVWICNNTLIAGFEQFAAAFAADLKEIPAFVLPSDTSKEKQLDLSLELIGAKKQLPLMTMARLAVLTDKIVDEPVKWLRERYNQHFWSITIDVFNRLNTLAISSSIVCDYFQKYDAPLSAAMSVVNLENIFQDKIIKWANENRVRPIELERIITDIIDCAKVEKINPKKVWEEIVEDDKNLLKKNLNERKNPLLTNLRKKTADAVNEFKKVTGIDVAFDPDFENPELEFKFKCKSEEEFKKILKKSETRITRIFTNKT